MLKRGIFTLVSAFYISGKTQGKEQSLMAGMKSGYLCEIRDVVMKHVIVYN